MLRFILLVLFALMFPFTAQAHHCLGGHATDPACNPPPPEQTLGNLNCTTDQIAKWDGAEWICAPDEIGAAGDQALQDQIDALQAQIDALPPPPSDGGIGILLDDDGDTIGKIVSIEHGNYKLTVVLDIPPYQIVKDLRKPNKYAQQSDPGGFAEGGVIFETTDCTGTGYVRETSGSSETRLAPYFSPLISGHTVGRDTVDDHRLYIPSGNGPTSIVARSQMGSQFGACTTEQYEDGVPYDDAIPLTLLVPNLHAIYPRPYSIVLY